MMEQVFVRLVEATAFTALVRVARWLTDMMSTGLSTSTMSPTDSNGRFCEHYTKECTILEQSMGCDQLTEYTLLHKDNQVWFSYSTTMNCSDDSWKATVQETSTPNFQGCYSSTRINRDMEDELKMGAKGIAGVYIGQEDCMEMLIEHQNACSLSLSISDCTFNQCGKLVRMTVSFDDCDSGASCSSSGNRSDSEDESYESDCEEDFIIFDSDSDGCHFTSECKGHPPNFDSYSLVNSPNAFEECCWQEKADFEENLAAFVKGINHPLYYNETTKGIKIANNNVPVIWSEPCTGKPKELAKSSSILNCEAHDVTLDHCERKAKTKLKTAKCVQFKPDPELVTKHSIVAWDFAYRQARIGPWERAAVDRLRFQKRIQELEEVLAPVLQEQKLKSEQKI